MLKQFLKIKKFLGRQGSGNFSSIMQGAGVDLAEQRMYSPGDEKRSINRKLSAKYDKLFVNLFHDEKALEVYILCDVNYNRHGKNAELFLRFFASLTSYFSSMKAHITGQIDHQTFNQLENIGHQKNFLDTIDKHTQKTFPIYSSSLETLLQAQLSLPKRRLILIISDFLDYGDKEKRMVAQLSLKHDVKLIQIPTGERVELPGALSLEVFEQ